LAASKTREAFDLSREPLPVRERYGDTDWGKDLLTARRLVEAGVRFVQCQANFRVRPETGRTTTWDDHSVNIDIFKAHEERLPGDDQQLPAGHALPSLWHRHPHRLHRPDRPAHPHPDRRRADRGTVLRPSSPSPWQGGAAVFPSPARGRGRGGGDRP